MRDIDRSKEELIVELNQLRQRNAELELALNKLPVFTNVPDLSLFSEYPTTVAGVNSYQENIYNQAAYSLADLIRMPLLGEVLTSFYEATGLPFAILDADNKVLASSGCQNICSKFHRASPQARSRCDESDRYILDHLHQDSFVSYSCLNGLREYAVPIVVDDQHLATLIVGQLLNDPPEEERFRRQAQEFGFDEAAYLQALQEIPVIPQEKAELIMKYYVQLSRIIAALGSVLKRQTKAVTKSEQKFSKIFNCIPDLVIISTLKTGRYVEVNDAFVEISGYKREEVLGRTIQELDIWGDPDQRKTVINKCREQGSVQNEEIKFRMKSGELRNFICSIEMFDMDGEEHMICTTKDITERIEMEEELRLSEECFSKAFNTCPVSMTITILEDGRFIEINDAFCSTIGFSREEALGRTAIELGFWGNLADRELVKQLVLTDQPVKDLEIIFYRKTGEQRLGLLSAEAIDIHGQLCLLSIVTDITDLRKMEIEMTRLDRLNMVGEMAASIGHEIRNPMTTVRGYLQLLQLSEHYDDEDEYFDLMIEELDHANSIITEFLSLAKDKAVDMTRENLNAIIRRSVPLLQATAMSQDQYINLHLNEIPDVLLDKKSIHQLIINLVNNGLESMNSGGCVTIRTSRETDHILLAIQDEGHGIDNDLINMLGTPFFTTKEQGTGLGLAVCYRIANQHNAKITPVTGKTGTTFYVRFPLDENPS